MTHLVTAAYRTDTEIDLPNRFHQFSHGHTSVTASKSLPSLNTEDHFQVFRSHVEEAVEPFLGTVNERIELVRQS